ncbi:hypothetical protein WA026_006404 [Henosepilachna vigintioctopunctata]|uniref:Glutamine amidotransferase type-2 domain-containing protein n=1 Tax=Henosepilachna vigintioctopunctata TaxID=420089 RepID=A0AAW1TPG9_9CUCU
MCGIFCIFSPSDYNITEKLSKTFQEFNFNISRRGPNHSKVEICHNEDQIFLFAGSVLWLQGSKLTKQPINEEEHILVYNGDIFDQDSSFSRSVHGDTKLFLTFLKSKASLHKLFNTNGPFSFIYLDKVNSTLYFGRDKYGRRSLLIGYCDDSFIITSVAKRNTDYKFMEVPSVGIFSINFNKKKQFHVKPWFEINHNILTKINELNIFLNEKIQIDESIITSSLFKEFVEPSAADLCSLDILKNVSSSNALTAITSSVNIANNLQELKNRLENAIQKRISNGVKFCQNCIREQKPCKHSIVGVLFSGGVDCAILAYMAHKFIEKDRPIDLLNVAFSNNDFNTPDRKTGLQSFEELKLLFPERTWNFVEINVTFEELDNERSNRIADLIYPLNTVLDDSLGCALWFASRGISGDYIPPCRILLVGMGADELFGGYTRHRAAFKSEGWFGLHNILREDWENLPYKNLGRDDRVVSDHGRQLRTPYLDEDVVNFVQNLNCWERTFPSDDVSQEIGTKFLLRALAFNLGFTKAAVLKKRALQFGCRIANSKENAHEVSPRL